MIQPGVPHSVQAITDCTLLHVFTGAPVDAQFVLPQPQPQPPQTVLPTAADTTTTTTTATSTTTTAAGGDRMQAEPTAGQTIAEAVLDVSLSWGSDEEGARR